MDPVDIRDLPAPPPAAMTWRRRLAIVVIAALAPAVVSAAPRLIELSLTVGDAEEVETGTVSALLNLDPELVRAVELLDRVRVTALEPGLATVRVLGPGIELVLRP
jgi:hypothetical protein